MLFSGVVHGLFKKDYGGLHPTQKPVALMRDLIETYSNEGDTILDFTMGSGSTMLACQNTNRNGIGLEINDNYFKVATDRVNQNKQKLF
jgi:site-specific DNA-methyltransferase (adenine-specific)